MENHVRLLGHINQPERFLRALDIFVLSSDSKEGVPQSLIQALMMGLPVISTDAGSINDLYAGDNFRMIDTGSSKAIADSIKDFLDNPSLQGGYASIARNSVETLTRDMMAEKIIKIYGKLKSR